MRGPHRRLWIGAMDGRGCREYGTLLRDGLFNFDYAVNVSWFVCDGCMDFLATLWSMDAILASAIQEVHVDLRDEVVSQEEVGTFFSSLRCSLH